MGNNVGAGAQVIGTILGASGQTDAGDAQLQAARYRQAQAQVNAGQDMAAGSAAVADEATKIKLLQSHALAVAGASGASVLDPNVVNIVSGIAKAGEYNQGMAMYNARMRAKSELDSGNAALWTGQVDQQASRTAAMGTILSGGAKAWSMSSWGSQ